MTMDTDIGTDTDPSLSVLPPTQITDAMFSSSTIAETDYPQWLVGTTYGLNDYVISTTTHRIYQSQIASNVGNDPTDIANQTGTTIYWVDMAPTNKWAMFDNEASTQSVSAPGSALTIVVTPGFFDTIWIGKVDAESVTITVKDMPGGTVIYSETSSLEKSAPPDYWEYFFSPFIPLSEELFIGIEPYNSAELTLTLTNGASSSSIGMLAIGVIQLLGETQYGATASPRSYSYIFTDNFGNTTIKRRKAVTDMTASCQLDIADANATLLAVQDLLDVPAVWIGTNIDVYSGLRCFGLGSGKMTYPSFGIAQFDLSVSGMI